MISAHQQPSPVQAAGQTTVPKPAWLELEPGEELLASYQGKQIVEVIVYVVLVVLMLCCLVTIVLLILGEVKKDAAGILTSVGGTVTGLCVTLGQIKKTQLHVTSKMLVFAEGKKFAGVPLSEVVALRRDDGSRWTIGIYIRGNAKAIGKITVLNTEQTEAELKEYCRRGGAKLQDGSAQ